MSENDIFQAMLTIFKRGAIVYNEITKKNRQM